MNYKSNEKMDIGDLGFLLIAFIVFIVNFFVKSNKEKTQSQKSGIPDMPEPWEMKEFLPPYPEKKVESLKTKTPRLLSSAQESLENMKKHKQASQEGMSSLSESLYKEDEFDEISYYDEGTTGISYTNDLFHGNITEELKKAVIYSEILHRKYE